MEVSEGFRPPREAMGAPSVATMFGTRAPGYAC